MNPSTLDGLYSPLAMDDVPKFNAAEALAKLGIKRISTKNSAVTHAKEYSTLEFLGLANKKSLKVRVVPFTDFDPPAGPKRLDSSVVDAKTLAWLQATDPGVTTNLENTDLTAVKTFVLQWAREHPDVLKALGIDDVKNLSGLSTSQAGTLAGYICVDRSRYNMGVLNAMENSGTPSFSKEDEAMRAVLERMKEAMPEAYEAFLKRAPWGPNTKTAPEAKTRIGEMDSRGVEGFLQNANSEQDGVCRNIVETYQAIWQVLVGQQRPDSNALANTYVKLPVNDSHIWVSLISVQSDGTLLATQIDPTWAQNILEPVQNTGGRISVDVMRNTLSSQYASTEPGESYALDPARLTDLNTLFQMGLGQRPSRKQEERDYSAVYYSAWGLAVAGDPHAGAQLLLEYLHMQPPGEQRALAKHWIQFLDDKGRPGFFWADENRVLVKDWLFPALLKEFPGIEQEE